MPSVPDGTQKWVVDPDTEQDFDELCNVAYGEARDDSADKPGRELGRLSGIHQARCGRDRPALSLVYAPNPEVFCKTEELGVFQLTTVAATAESHEGSGRADQESIHRVHQSRCSLTVSA
jgi:hypothetical protein